MLCVFLQSHAAALELDTAYTEPFMEKESAKSECNR